MGGALEGPLGTAAALHLAASSPSIRYGCEQIGAFLLTADINRGAIAMTEGTLVVPDGPGLGVDLNLEVVGEYEVKRTEVRG